ncbi:carbohydrate ABC transporter permease, partial [Agrobacterium sp. S2]|nr:carbohydrate ABC transporter permease [Agrobacterium sp. S2]
LPRARCDVLAVRRGPHVPDDGGHHAAVHHDQEPRPHEQPGRHHPAADRLRAADDDHHPGAVPAGHPEGAGGGAAIDGASRLGFFFRMVVPLSVPGVVTVGILAFIASWNSYMLPLFILNDDSTYTLPLGVQAFASQYSVDTARVLAFTSLSMIPALIFFSPFERRIVGGLTGAVKG